MLSEFVRKRPVWPFYTRSLSLGLFTVNYKLALEHRAEIHATLNEVREMMRWMQPAIAALQAETAKPRAEIVRAPSTRR